MVRDPRFVLGNDASVQGRLYFNRTVLHSTMYYRTTALIDAHRPELGMGPSSSLSASTLPSCDDDPAETPTGTIEPLIEFKLFSDLPSELRLKTWDYAVFLLRIVKVRA